MYKTRFLFEADDDDTAPNNDGGNNAADANNTAGGDDNADDAKEAEDDDKDVSEDDFAINGGEGEDAGDETPDQPPEFDTGAASSAPASSASPNAVQVQVSSDSAKAKEKEVFDSLDPSEQKIKIKELKRLFSDLYNNCNIITDKINSIAVEYETNYDQFQRSINTLYELKQMISFYILNLFDSKSYFENDLMYNKYLIILDSVKNVITMIKKEHINDNEGK